MAVLDEGYYCTNCGYFETDIDFNDVTSCAACGCDKDAHARAQVIESDV